MSKAINSPTGRLLRASRLFSLPPPLPAAPILASEAGRILRASDSATQPYPTHQAISTPASSRSRGDWGLKRPLPDRAIPRNVAHLRIKAVDTLEHITDFESAADHTQSVAKWQEMDIPLSQPPGWRTSMSDDGNKYLPSAFDEKYDNTTLNPHGNEKSGFTAERALRERRRKAMSVVEEGDESTRWRTQGPYLLDMTEQQFENYLEKLVRDHKQEFRKFLEAVKIEKKRTLETDRMRNTSDNAATFEVELQHRTKLDRFEVDDWIKELRDSHTDLNSELSQLIREFFDLPAFPPRQDSLSRYGKKDGGPPSTHPSAGLSYGLTNAVLKNHPVYGPLADREPVQARVLRSVTANHTRDRTADVGVGGFVTTYRPNGSTNAVQRTHFKSTDTTTTDPLTNLDVSLVGGGKFWAQPRSAYIDESGRVRLSVQEASKVSTDIKLDNPVEEHAAADYRPASGRQNEPLDFGFKRPTPNYGFGLPDERSRLRNNRETERESENRSTLSQLEELARPRN